MCTLFLLLRGRPAILLSEASLMLPLRRAALSLSGAPAILSHVLRGSFRANPSHSTILTLR